MGPLELGICSWSINRRDPVSAIRTAGRRYGLRVVHLGFFDEQTLAATTADAVRKAADDVGVEISSTFAAFAGEDYQSIASVARSGGYLPDGLFDARLDMTRRVGDLAAELDVRSVAVHVGTVPGDVACDAYKTLADRTGCAADVLLDRGLMLLLETGRESAQALGEFIDVVGRGNVAVNYDPGNMVLYGTDDPVRTVTTLGSRIRHVHLKDAIPSDNPGATMGTEVTLGTGEASIARVVSKLRAGGYSGPLIVERTAGRGDPGGLEESIDYLRSLLD